MSLQKRLRDQMLIDRDERNLSVSARDEISPLSAGFAEGLRYNSLNVINNLTKKDETTIPSPEEYEGMPFKNYNIPYISGNSVQDYEEILEHRSSQARVDTDISGWGYVSYFAGALAAELLEPFNLALPAIPVARAAKAVNSFDKIKDVTQKIDKIVTKAPKPIKQAGRYAAAAGAVEGARLPFYAQAEERIGADSPWLEASKIAGFGVAAGTGLGALIGGGSSAFAKRKNKTPSTSKPVQPEQRLASAEDAVIREEEVGLERGGPPTEAADAFVEEPAPPGVIEQPRDDGITGISYEYMNIGKIADEVTPKTQDMIPDDPYTNPVKPAHDEYNFSLDESRFQDLARTIERGGRRWGETEMGEPFENTYTKMYDDAFDEARAVEASRRQALDDLFTCNIQNQPI